MQHDDERLAAAALLEAGADPDAADHTGMTALYGAVEMATLGVVFGGPPLPRTDQHDVLDIVRLALAHGADPNARLAESILARHHGFPDRTLGAGATSLMRVAKGHDIESVRVLLEAHASAKAQQGDGSSVLHVMATARLTRNDEEAATERDLLDLLLQAGAEIEAVANDGQTPLHRAARNGNRGLVTLLFERGAPTSRRASVVAPSGTVRCAECAHHLDRPSPWPV